MKSIGKNHSKKTSAIPVTQLREGFAGFVKNRYLCKIDVIREKYIYVNRRRKVGKNGEFNRHE